MSTLIGHGPGQIFRIALRTFQSDVVFCWFGSVYAAAAVFFGRIYGRKSVIILGGVDVARDESLHYGLWLNPWKARLARYALTHANRVFVGDRAMKNDAVRLAGYDGKNIDYLAPGLDCEYWKPVGEKQPIVLTVAGIRDENRLHVKGIDILLSAAQILTNLKFIVIGIDSSVVQRLSVPDNVVIHGPMLRQELLAFYRRAKIYCQPSRLEAVGYSLREAMLCGCFPVVSDVGGLHTAAAGTGLLIPPGDVQALVAALQKALRTRDAEGAKARAHVVALYPAESRRTELVNIIERLFA